MGLSPSHACVSVLVLLGEADPPHFTHHINRPPTLHPALPVHGVARHTMSAYTLCHIDRVSGEAATGARITGIMSQRLQG